MNEKRKKLIKEIHGFLKITDIEIGVEVYNDDCCETADVDVYAKNSGDSDWCLIIENIDLFNLTHERLKGEYRNLLDEE